LKKSFLFLVLILAVVLPLMDTHPCLADAAEPPSILIIVSHAPKDLEITLETTGIKAYRTDKTIESYFAFYSRDLIDSLPYRFKVTTGGISFEITLDAPLNRYDNIFTLNLAARTLTPGGSVSRSIELPALRILLTLVIEGIIFFLFGYRSKRSWISFLVINLISLAFINILLLGNVKPLQDEFLIFTLFFGEVLVFIFEMITFMIAIREHSRWRTALYVVAANMASLILGGFLITILPI
jgi:hypothetical protein